MSNLETDIWDRDDTESASEYEEFSEDQDDGLDEDDLKEWSETLYEDETEEDEADFGTSVVESARIRLEQGRLYEMLIKHDLFDGVDAIPEAVAKVQKELKDYIVERLEILLGMRAEAQKQQVQQVVTLPQFNDVEVQALKMVAAQVTKGASKNAPTTQQVQKEPEQRPNTIKEKPKSLNKISSVVERRSVPVQKKPVQQVKQTQRPIQKKQTPQTKSRIDEKLINKSFSSEVEAATKDIKYIEKLKTMTLEEANKVVSERHKRPQPPASNISQDMVNSHYQNKMALNQTAQTFATLLAVAKQK